MKNIKKEAMYAALIVMIGSGLTFLLMSGKDKNRFPEQHGHIITVETLSVQKKDYRLSIPAWGFVEPSEIIDIRSELSGKIDFVSNDLFRGARVMKGQLLFSLDKREYLNILAEAEAAAEESRQALKKEMGWQKIVKKEVELLDDPDLIAGKNPLMLRQPQLKELEARLRASTARQDQARLDLERTQITSHCTGVILEESVAPGRYLDTGDISLKLACTGFYNIIAFYPSEYSLDTGGSNPRIRINGRQYEGRVKAVIPQIDSATRQKQALIEFKGDDITIGDYAGLTLSGNCLTDVAVLEKEVLRTSNAVWVLSPAKTLEIRNVTIIGEDSRHVCIAEGLENGDLVIVSHIASPLQGMKLNKKEPVRIAQHDEASSGETRK